MPEYSHNEISDLIEGKLPWSILKPIMSSPKDNDRFDKYVEVLQEKVPWTEKILLPISEHLFIVQKGKDRIVKCDCGNEFGDYRENWKLKALIEVLDSEEKLEDIYNGTGKPDPHLCQIRQYYCPACGTQLEVESVTVGEPIIFEFLPDIDTFYREWLGRPLEDEKEFKDLSYEVTRRWGEEK